MDSGLQDYIENLSNGIAENLRNGFKQKKKEYELLVAQHYRNVEKVSYNNIKNASTTDMSLSLVAVLFLQYIAGKSINNNKIAIYWTTFYGVTDYNKMLHFLIENDFLEFSNYIFNMSKCTVAQLKTILQTHNLPLKGSKQELITTLCNNISSTELSKIFNDTHLLLTQKGENLINAHPHIIYYHTYRNTLDPQLTLHTVHDLYNASKWETVEDLFIVYHNSVMGDYWENKQYGLARNALLSIAEIDFRRAKYAEALANFLSVSYLDMTGLDNFTQYRTAFTAEDKENLQLAPGIMSYVTICLRNIGATINDLPDAYSLAVQNIDVAYAAYSKQEVLSLIAEEIAKLWNT